MGDDKENKELQEKIERIKRSVARISELQEELKNPEVKPKITLPAKGADNYRSYRKPKKDKPRLTLIKGGKEDGQG